MDALAPWSAHAGEAFGQRPCRQALRLGSAKANFIYVEEYDLMI
ncbi:hypothetical protein [Pseudomonas sp. TH34]|nr:hypothetical protein [Pseudomonas sp. TH34]